MSKSFKLASTILATGLLITPISGIIYHQDNIVKANENNKLNYFNENDIKEIENFLHKLDKIPEDLLLNGNHKEIKNYLWKNKIYLNIYNDNIGETEKDILIIKPRGFWGCVGALGEVLLTTAIPAGKLIKIKNYVKHLGGVTDAVRYLLGIKGAARGTIIYENLVALVGEISGFSNIKNNCF